MKYATITHDRLMSPRSDGGATIITRLTFHGYWDEVSAKLSDGYFEVRDEEPRAHAENVFKLIDRLAERYSSLMTRIGWLEPMISDEAGK